MTAIINATHMPTFEMKKKCNKTIPFDFIACGKDW